MEPGRCDVMTRGDATLDAMYRATRPNAVVESRRDHARGELCRGGGAADPRSVTDARRKRPTDLGMVLNEPFSRVFEPRVLGKVPCLSCMRIVARKSPNKTRVYGLTFVFHFIFQLDDELELRLRRRLLLPLLLDDGERPRPRPPPPRLGGGGDLLRRLPPTLPPPPPPPRPRPRLLLRLRLRLLLLERLDRDRDLLEYDRE